MLGTMCMIDGFPAVMDDLTVFAENRSEHGQT
jgi:hypothetical protein